MPDLYQSHTRLLSRCAIISILALNLLTTSGCGLFSPSRKVVVPPVLPVTEANMQQLVAEVNRLAEVRSLKGKVDIQFQDTSFAESGIAEKYSAADGTVYLQRPGKIYLAIQAPFVGTDIAKMTSDGERFRIAVLKGAEKYRRFVIGTNNAVYPKLATDDAKTERGKGKKSRTMSDEQTVSVLSNLRPQHFTDALLIRPILPREQTGFVYAQSEFYQEEPDTRPRAKKDARIVRGYYMLDELAAGGAGGVHLNRRIWFDRVGSIRLARVQTYDEAGALITDVVYGETKNFGEGNLPLPSRIELTRPHDGYKLSMSYQAPEAVTLNTEFDPGIFVLKNDTNLPEVDLDAREKNRAVKRQ